MESQTVTYRNQIIRQNPLTNDWLVDLLEPYGAYTGSLSEMKKVVDRYHEIESAKVLA